MVALTNSMVKSLSPEALNGLPAEEKKAALELLPLSKRINSLAANSSLGLTSLYRTVHDFLIATVDTPSERIHIVAEVNLALDHYISPSFGGTDNSMYRNVKELSLELLNRLLTKIGNTTPLLTHEDLAFVKSQHFDGIA